MNLKKLYFAVGCVSCVIGWMLLTFEKHKPVIAHSPVTISVTEVVISILGSIVITGGGFVISYAVYLYFTEPKKKSSPE